MRTTSGDPDLDLLLIRFHLESGARREGALNLRRRDLDPTRATVWLREKNDSEREQPVTPTLLTLLERHANGRGSRSADDPVFRTATGAPVTARRYDTIFTRARTCLPWGVKQPPMLDCRQSKRHHQNAGERGHLLCHQPTRSHGRRCRQHRRPRCVRQLQPQRRHGAAAYREVGAIIGSEVLDEGEQSTARRLL